MNKRFRSVITWVLVTLMMITTVSMGMLARCVEAASSEDRFDEGNYTIQYILANCSYCVENKLTNKLTNNGDAAHTVGSILVGELDFTQSYGNFFKIPAYIGTITDVNYMCNQYSASAPYSANRVVYYGTDEGSFAGSQINNNGSGAQPVENAEYMDLSKAFESLKSQSAALAAKGSTSAYTYSGGVLTLNFSSKIKNIPNATAVNITNLNGHLVAPKATVTLIGGRHEGNVIASNVSSGSEAHFYPLGGTIVNNGTDPGTDPGSGDETTTYDVTISKKAVGSSVELTGAKLKVTGRASGAAEDITPITWTSNKSDGPKY